MFRLSEAELENLRYQIGISSSSNYGGRRYMPYVFTEQGVAMLSSVLNSDRAVQVNIAIMRAFVNIRKMALTNEEVAKKLAAIEKRIDHHDESFKKVFGAIRAMLNPPAKAEKQIGYIRNRKRS
ncbi:MAG: ORF6N domain-containing protein [Chloracidobacterium sp.]|nr:ORF6N domain-containing protein [Chloracidobacterium sp.]MCO5332861.1 ORF6N domain-containing protein [Pyrinomonadaceae bacterium]